MNGRLPKPLTPAQALALTITVVGELCQQRALCPPSQLLGNDGPLIDKAMREWLDSDDDDDYEDPTVGMSTECAEIYRAYMQEKRKWPRRGR